jgi:hypothetical protein
MDSNSSCYTAAAQLYWYGYRCTATHLQHASQQPACRQAAAACSAPQFAQLHVYKAELCGAWCFQHATASFLSKDAQLCVPGLNHTCWDLATAIVLACSTSSTSSQQMMINCLPSLANCKLQESSPLRYCQKTTACLRNRLVSLLDSIAQGNCCSLQCRTS